VGARLLSSAFNFFFNRRLVFKDGGRVLGAAGRYYLLAAGLFLIGNTILNPIVHAFDLEAGYATAVKAAVDTVLFVASFHIQRKWVFSERRI
jgi:dolichol-phosphate mannosyltransferase